MERLEQGDIICKVDETFPLDRISEAHSFVLNHLDKKVVLLVNIM